MRWRRRSSAIQRGPSPGREGRWYRISNCSSQPPSLFRIVTLIGRRLLRLRGLTRSARRFDHRRRRCFARHRLRLRSPVWRQRPNLSRPLPSECPGTCNRVGRQRDLQIAPYHWSIAADWGAPTGSMSLERGHAAVPVGSDTRIAQACIATRPLLRLAVPCGLACGQVGKGIRCRYGCWRAGLERRSAGSGCLEPFAPRRHGPRRRQAASTCGPMRPGKQFWEMTARGHSSGQREVEMQKASRVPMQDAADRRGARLGYSHAGRRRRSVRSGYPTVRVRPADRYTTPLALERAEP